MDIDNLPAGQELDALVAEKVMDWQWRAWGDPPQRCLYSPEAIASTVEYDLLGQVRLPTVSETTVPACGDEPIHPVGHVPHYSTDIAAAWQVVGQLLERGLHVVIATPPPGWKNWDVRGWNPETNSSRFISHADSAPLAICRAALEAVNAHPVS